MKLFGITDQGLVRQNNQDNYVIAYNGVGDVLIIVCDGMGGAKAGDIASFEAIQYFSEVFALNQGFKSLEDIKEYLRYHIRKANEDIFTLATTSINYTGMGTTLVGVLLTKKYKIGFNIGDSRIYTIKNNNIYQVTVDHSYVNELLKKGEIDYESVKNHPKKNMLTKALGAFGSVTADYYLFNDFVEYMLLCSDGLHGLVDDEVLLSIVSQTNLTLQEKSNQLLKSALDAGGVDNITLVLVKFKEDDYE